MTESNQPQPVTQPQSKKPKRHPEKKIGPFNAGIGACVCSASWPVMIECNAG